MFAPTTRVLIVDDMSTMRKIVGKTCKELGFSDLTEAADGIQAWEALNNAPAPIGLIISDWNMPNCTGIDLLKRVRGDSRFSKIPFLLVTAEAEQHQVIEAVKAGVDQYVVKPFTKDDLKTKLEAVYKKYAK
jgi:two-component system, chemotaxis family, chemotaxis protein CheY